MSLRLPLCIVLGLLVVSALVMAGCGGQPSAPVASSAAATAIPAPPTATIAAPWVTVPPTATPVPPTATPVSSTLTPTPLPLTPTPTPARTQSTASGSRVVGTINGGANIALALFAQQPDGRFVISMQDDTPQTRTDESGRFEFAGIPPGSYILLSPRNGSFGFFTEPSDQSLVASRLDFPRLWVFKVSQGKDVDIGRVSPTWKGS